jgi:signal transduction histidine kinase
MESRRVDRTVGLAFAAVVISFVSATWLSERQSAEVERAALSIHRNAAPSIHRLAAARAELRRLQLLVHRALEEDAGRSKVVEISAGRELLDQQLVAYQALPLYPGEGAAWQRAKSAAARLEETLSEIVAALERGDVSSAHQLEARFDGSIEDLARTLSQDIDVNVAAAGRLAADIQKSRRDGIVWALMLDGIGVLMAVAAAAWSLRVARAHARAVQAFSEMAERRAEELDQFAGRMAHDVRSPLSVVSMSLSMADRYGGDDPRFRRAIKRAADASRQTETLIEALFDFARAGARPDPRARASVSKAVEGVAVNVCTRAEQVGADVVVRASAHAAVACPAGLVESAISNLVNNALTYVEGREKRVVAIEATDESGTVKVTVSDTGPGLPDGTDPAALFEPNVRGPNARGRGLGLGLATVKKVVEAHGGRVGVSSSSEGCVFWFTLPALPNLVLAERDPSEKQALPS